MTQFYSVDIEQGSIIQVEKLVSLYCSKDRGVGNVADSAIDDIQRHHMKVRPFGHWIKVTTLTFLTHTHTHTTALLQHLQPPPKDLVGNLAACGCRHRAHARGGQSHAQARAPRSGQEGRARAARAQRERGRPVLRRVLQGNHRYHDRKPPKQAQIGPAGHQARTISLRAQSLP